MNRAERRRQQKLAGKAAPAARRDPESEYMRGNTLHDRGDFRGAVASYRNAIALRPDFAEAHHNLGLALKDSGNLAEAVGHFTKAAALLPNSADAHINLGSALLDARNPAAAVSAYRHALSVSDDRLSALFNLGVALKELGKLDEAATCYRDAIQLKPDFSDAHYNLLQLLEISNSDDALRLAVAEAKRLCPQDGRIVMGEAWLLKRDGEFAAARSVLESAGDGYNDPGFLSERAYLLGDICDRSDDPEAAFRYFRDGGRLARRTPAGKRVRGSRFVDRIDALTRRFTAGWVAEWQDACPEDERPDPVFLVGFPRSGTTLLDTILRSHSGIAVVEEIPAIHAMRTVLKKMTGGDPDGLALLDAAAVTTLRRTYFSKIDETLEPGDQSAIVIDKLPLNIVDAGMIHRVFPNARFLLVLRHPCDCVLSCFMQSFSLNDAMANFLDIEDAARLYDKVMTLWQRYRELLPLNHCTVFYEDLLEGFDETLSPLLDFLGLEWDDGMRQYAETARRRERIHTPSYYQVTQPLYTRARGRWERYRTPMQPVLPDLLGWAARLGYDK